MPEKVSVLFVCVHNAGRSQMAAAYLAQLGGDRVNVLSAGSAPADAVNPAVVAAMREEGIDIAAQRPKILTTEAVSVSDVVITMGCGDVCPFFPGKRYEDWVLEDPAGRGVESVRPIRDEIRRRVEELLAEILPVQAAGTSSAPTRPHVPGDRAPSILAGDELRHQERQVVSQVSPDAFLQPVKDAPKH